jgi:hypothetical protein
MPLFYLAGTEMMTIELCLIWRLCFKVRTLRILASVKYNYNSRAKDLTVTRITFAAISMSDIGDVRVVLDHYSKFADPISEFREKTRLFAEQEKERERMLVNLKQKTPGVSPPSFSFIPSFLRRS